MSWDDRLLPAAPEATLASRVEALLDQQRASWALLRDGEAALLQLRTKQLRDGEAAVWVQANPGRRGSSDAKVDARSVAQRPCFLCETNLPADERGVDYGAELVIAPNPFPILAGHLSAIHRRHVPQTLQGRSATLLELAAALGPAHLVLYNGPRCGASAPDHFHLQAARRGPLPIADDLARQAPTGALVALESFGRRVLVLRGDVPAALAARLDAALAALAALHDDGAVEPMLNLIVTSEAGGQTVYLFPRAAHRPACFYAEGEARILISPGALDMAGIVVVADPDHFDRVDAAVVRQVYDEVSLDPARFARLVEALP